MLLISFVKTKHLSNTFFKIDEKVRQISWYFDFSRFRSIKKSDEGLYECQISTEPKMSYYIRLLVVGKKVFLQLMANLSRS